MISQFFSQTDLVTWLLLFVSYFCLNVLYTKNALYTYRLEPFKAANSGIIIAALGYYGIAEFVKDPSNIIPILLATYLGEYLTLAWEIKISKRNGRRNKKQIVGKNKVPGKVNKLL